MQACKTKRIHESVSELLRLVSCVASQAARNRLDLLILFRENPGATTHDAAAKLGISERTIRRWWKRYEEKGLRSLLGDAERVAFESNDHTSGDNAPVVPIEVVHFLNALPRSSDTFAWAEAVSTALIRLLHDVDRVSVIVDLDLKPDASSAEPTAVTFTRHVDLHSGAKPRVRLVTAQVDRESGSRVVQEAVRNGFPVDRYHTPIVFDFELESGDYVGSIVLWRDRDKHDISVRTIELLRSLHPFLLFLLTDCIARKQSSDPSFQAFTGLVERICNDGRLTPREHEVLLQRLAGLDYDAIAERMHVSVSTVRKHASNLHHKTDTHTLTELFARYFSPYLDR